MLKVDVKSTRGGRVRETALLVSSSIVAVMLGVASPAAAATIFTGNLVVSSLTYEGSASTVQVGQSLPNTSGATAIANGSFGAVFQNTTVDSDFGVTAPYSLQFYSATGQTATQTSTYNVPSASFTGSFSSKSEGAINVSPDGQSITLMGYNAGVNQLDVSNTNTPGSTETGNPDIATPTYRTIAQINSNGTTQFTSTNAYSGDNGRAAILGGDGNYYTVGNAGGGNGDGNIATLAGVQRIAPGASPTSTQEVGTVNAAAYGVIDKKPAKENNFVGETIFNNTVYVTKDSGSNGIDTVYQVGAAGSLPTTGTTNAITVLPGFPTGAAKTNTANFFPFGIWFANSTTLYVADAGDGVLADAASDANAGLEKWTYDPVSQQWVKDYTLQLGLNLGANYTVTGVDAAGDSGSYTTATDGLRNIIGQVNADGTVTIFGVTSTISSGTGDPGADPDKLVAITDTLANTTASGASGESFFTLATANYGQVFRGVALVTPVPEPASWVMMILGVFGLGLTLRSRRTSTGPAKA